MADAVEFELMQWVQTLPTERRADAQMLYMRQRKEPGTALGLSLLMFLGLAGIGRMYKGDVLLGVLMFFFGVLTCGIWPLIDLFLISGSTEQANRELLARVRMTLRG